MSNSIEEFFYKLNEWLDAKYATYGNVEVSMSQNFFLLSPMLRVKWVSFIRGKHFKPGPELEVEAKA